MKSCFQEIVLQIVYRLQFSFIVWGGGDGKACPSGVSIHIIEMEITSSSDSGDQLVD